MTASSSSSDAARRIISADFDLNGFGVSRTSSRIKCFGFLNFLRMSSPVPNRDISTGQRVIASSSGAVATALFMTPFDVVKVRLQSQQKALLHNRCYAYCNVLVEQVCVCPGGERVWHQIPLKGELKGTGVANAFSISQCIK